jgi:AAA domain
MIDTLKLGDVVASNIEKLCQHFFPLGKKDGNEWKIANVSGAKGDSLCICLSPDKAGLWHDFATDDKGKFVDLLMCSRNISFPFAADEISRFLGIELSSRNGSEPQVMDWDWASCLKLSEEHAKRLARWRGLSEQFVQWLVETDLVRVYNKNGSQRWVFPVHLDGRVAGCHSRPIEWAGPERCPWLILPKNEKGGPGMRPLIIGDFASARSVHVFESQWDMFAVCDRLSLHLTDGVVTVSTRGAQNAKLVSIVPNSVREAYLWQQNDTAGQGWSDAVARYLPIATTAKIVPTPSQYEDPNAWTLKGKATSDDLCAAISAAVLLDATKQEENQKPKGRALTGGSIVSFANTPVDHTQTLLGTRYLCVGGGMFVVAQSGAGKSSLAIQAGILWSCGRPAFEIRPSRPLRILIVQAEDDKGDVTEAAAMIRQLGLSESETALADVNTWLEHVNDVCGDAFIAELDAILEQHPADIVIINPFTAYLGSDEKDTEACTRFLRNQLNPLLSRHKCAAVIIHHTPKVNFNRTDDYRASDWMYRGSGAATLTNWARAYLTIDRCDNQPGTYRFIAAKRGQRIGWASNDGNPVLERYFCHSTIPGVILWDAVDEKDAPKLNSKFKALDLDKLLALVPVLDPELKNAFNQRAAQELRVGINKIKDAMQQLEVDRKVFTRPIPNPGKGRNFSGWAKTPGSGEQNGQVE